MSRLPLLALTFTLLLTSCKPRVAPTDGKIKVVCTIFPEYDWARQMAGEDNEKILLTLIVKNGLDLHTFQPTEADIAQIQNADLLIYNGGSSEDWVKTALSGTSNPNQKVINLTEVLEQRLIDGDEHLWLSLQNAEYSCKAIANALAQLDPQNLATYKKHYEKYAAELELLAQQFDYATLTATKHTLIFADRFPFAYLLSDYGLNYYSVFEGCNTQTEPTEQAIAFIADKINELDVDFLYVIETSDDKLPKAITSKAHNYNCDTIRIDSMQATTLRSAIGGKTYIKTMQKNLEQLERGLKPKEPLL